MTFQQFFKEIVHKNGQFATILINYGFSNCQVDKVLDHIFVSPKDSLELPNRLKELHSFELPISKKEMADLITKFPKLISSQSGPKLLLQSKIVNRLNHRFYNK